MFLSKRVNANQSSIFKLLHSDHCKTWNEKPTTQFLFKKKKYLVIHAILIKKTTLFTILFHFCFFEFVYKRTMMCAGVWILKKN